MQTTYNIATRQYTVIDRDIAQKTTNPSRVLAIKNAIMKRYIFDVVKRVSVKSDRHTYNVPVQYNSDTCGHMYQRRHDSNYKDCVKCGHVTKCS